MPGTFVPIGEPKAHEVLRATNGIAAIRHPVSLRATFASLSVDSGEDLTVLRLASLGL